MVSRFEQELQDAFDEFQRRRQEAVDVHRGLAEIEVTVTAPRTVVSVTVGQHGQVRNVRFPSTAYRRLTPSELAAAVLDTITKAQAESRDKMAELMGPMTPPGFDLKSMMDGTADLDALLPKDFDANGFFGRPMT
ncbi:YbaB/EbfC family nucleoid-associated protein [Kibdelosporangium philippinense]|uniref:YbaB/EbfC family nucleoid-associated protein n=1 Tax=Kibdelosporangium philippinense TaxID=211113 RepID=A0ABS8ZVM7_9PSEU|nr:YbaB/EbfC family nucleoid-associated protein [Kibdelosporangium philippinense]MCE7011753.1 YbaB/EbfC family nucleoid-associated protein [Kibdelosporangium philippinense]